MNASRNYCSLEYVTLPAAMGQNGGSSTGCLANDGLNEPFVIRVRLPRKDLAGNRKDENR
ncbi:MAG: hypothetical protein OEU92_34155 [Alphaproteobacteria bacterium]|nr:hypothetical protein [Alphaproteobacteria bacterium]